MNSWLAQHQAACGRAVRRLLAAPLNTLLSLLVIGIALTIPAFGYLVLDSLRQLGHGAAGAQQVSVFMQLDASKKDVSEIEARLQAAAPGRWRFVPRDEALARLKGNEGMAEIVASLPRNPLPDAFVVEPPNPAPEALEVLKKEISGWPRVEHVQLDSAWVRRFDAFIRIGRLALGMLAAVFAAGLVAVTFNTIRLQVLGHAAEIEVARMIGATDAFISRPFHYFGALQGAAGGLLAALLVALGLALLAAPVGELAALYGAQFALRTPGLAEVAALVGCGGLLGWLGGQLSVHLSLRQFD
ncbi:permease-like cell division protein FtsX [Dechloromonas sp. ZY10]|uniref:permease-like cell division protein FtsX n=1 Tax=Dechloromonas aquae TaxID=2664436 RepID=UPI003526E5C7